MVPHRKLKTFYQQPLDAISNITAGDIGIRKKYLFLWYFEDQLKETYTSYVLALNRVAHDTVDSNKEKAIGAMYKLLAENSEQEKVCFSINFFTCINTQFFIIQIILFNDITINKHIYLVK